MRTPGFSGAYVQALRTRWRGYAVINPRYVSEKKGRALVLRYEPVSRHFTWKGAQKAAAKINRKDGRTP